MRRKYGRKFLQLSKCLGVRTVLVVVGKLDLGQEGGEGGIYSKPAAGNRVTNKIEYIA